MVEKSADFATGFSETLLFENNCYSVSARIVYCFCEVNGHIHLAAKLVSVALVFFGLAFPTFSFSFWKSFFLSFLCLLDFVILYDEICSYHVSGYTIYTSSECNRLLTNGDLLHQMSAETSMSWHELGEVAGWLAVALELSIYEP